MADCQGIGGQGCSSNASTSTIASTSSDHRISGRCGYQRSLYVPVRLSDDTMPASTRLSLGQPTFLISAENALIVEDLVSDVLACNNGCCNGSRTAGSAEPRYNANVPVAGALVEGRLEHQDDIDSDISELTQGHVAASEEEGSHETPIYVALKLDDYRSMISRAKKMRDIKEQNSAMRAEMLVRREDMERSEKLAGQLSETLQCTICIETFSAPHTLSCGHTFCKECLVQWLAVSKMCPTCRAPVTQRPSVSYTIQEMVSCINADTVEGQSSTSASTTVTTAATRDGNSTQVDPWTCIFDSPHNDQAQQLQQEDESLFDTGSRCIVCDQYTIRNERCLNCIQNLRVERAEFAERLQSIWNHLDPSEAPNLRRGTDTSLGLDDFFSGLSIAGEDESLGNDLPFTSSVGSDASAATDRLSHTSRYSASIVSSARQSLVSRPASPVEPNFALNEIFDMVPQPRIPAYRLATQPTSRANADADAAQSSIQHDATNLRRQVRSSLSSSSRIPFARSVFTSGASSEETGAILRHPAHQGFNGNAASGSNVSASTRNPIRIRAIMGQEQNHSRGAASSSDSATLPERHMHFADRSRNSGRLHSGSSLQLVTPAPRVVVSSSSDTRGSDQGISRACRNSNSSVIANGSRSNNTNTNRSNGNGYTSRLFTRSGNNSNNSSGSSSGNSRLDRQRTSDPTTSEPDRLQRYLQLMNSLRTHEDFLATSSELSSEQAASGSRDTDQLSSVSSRSSRATAAEAFGLRAARRLASSQLALSEHTAANSYASFDQDNDDYDYHAGDMGGAWAVRASSSSRNGRSHNAGHR